MGWKLDRNANTFTARYDDFCGPDCLANYNELLALLQGYQDEVQKDLRSRDNFEALCGLSLRLASDISWREPVDCCLDRICVAFTRDF